MSRKKDRSDLTLFIPFLLVHDYLFDDKTSLEYICKGFQVFFYILGVKVTDLVSLISYVCMSRKDSNSVKRATLLLLRSGHRRDVILYYL